MKRMKKILAMVMAMAMVLGMSLTVFADETEKAYTGDITITLPESLTRANATITYEQIVEADQTDTTGWVLCEGITLSNSVTLADLISVGEAQKELGANYYASEGAINPNEKVAKAIESLTLSETLEAPAQVIENVAPGLYVIEVSATGYTFSRMLVYVPFNGDSGDSTSVSVTAKGETNQVTKEIAGTDEEKATYTSVTAGDIVPFTITAKYPSFDQNVQNPTFSMKDKLTGGSVKIDATHPFTVTVGDVDAQESETTIENIPTYTKTANADGTEGFTLTFNYESVYARKEVVISYYVEVGTTDENLKNEVEETTGGNTTSAEVISPKVKFEVTKTGENDALLSGAEFTLYIVANETDTPNAYLKDNKITDKGEEETDFTVPTDAIALVKFKVGETESNGIYTFTGLDAQREYYVVETKAPAGYSLDDNAKEVEGATFEEGSPVTNNGHTVIENKATDFTGQTISDTKLNALPSTGGIGTTIFTIGGVAIMVVAAGLFFVTRKKASK